MSPTIYTSISPFGVWVLIGDNEYFLDHKRFPWFKSASVEDVLAVENPRKDHLYWPALDIDLHLDSLTHPERYPLTAKKRTTTSEPRRARA